MSVWSILSNIGFKTIYLYKFTIFEIYTHLSSVWTNFDQLPTPYICIIELLKMWIRHLEVSNARPGPIG